MKTKANPTKLDATHDVIYRHIYNQQRNFRYQSEDDLPVILLGRKVEFNYWDIHLELSGSKKYPLQLVNHQCGGLSCLQYYFQGIIFKQPKIKDVERAIFWNGVNYLDKLYLDSQITSFNLKTQNEYAKKVKRIFGNNVSCDRVCDELREGLYPLECNEWILKVLFGSRVPLLHNLIKLENNGYGKIRKIIYNNPDYWTVYILGRNSD